MSLLGLAVVLGGCERTELGLRKTPQLGVQNFDDGGGTVDPTETTGSDPTSDTTSSTSSTSPTSSSTSSTTTTTGEPPDGIDVSHWNGDVDWDTVAGEGIGFAIVKASEGTYYTSDTFAQQYDGSYDVGLIRGSYHFAIPDDSGGAEQADYFVDNGGGWSADGQTLPGTLDIEWNPYWSDACYGLSQGQMIDWIADFLDQYFVRTGRDAIIYTAASWWSQCVDASDFADYPLWVAHYGVSVPNLPVGWSSYDFWQTSGYGAVNGVDGDCDIDVYGGSPDQLYHFALEP